LEQRFDRLDDYLRDLKARSREEHDRKQPQQPLSAMMAASSLLEQPDARDRYTRAHPHH
jgi:hypothetical protein